MVYVYALAADLGDVADLRGVQDEALLTIPLSGGVIVAGEVSAQPSLEADTLIRQDALVRTLHERAAALLPMRFGTTAPTAEDVVRLVLSREHTLERLEAVRGCEQMIVRVLGPTHPVEEHVPAMATGTQYLQSRARLHRPDAELTAMAAAAGSLQRDVRIEPAQQPGLHGSVYHLIERGHAGEYRLAIERGAATLPGVRVIISGPLPAYAFV